MNGAHSRKGSRCWRIGTMALLGCGLVTCDSVVAGNGERGDNPAVQPVDVVLSDVDGDFNPQMYASIKSLGSVRIKRFRVTRNLRVDLVLARTEVFAPETRITVNGMDRGPVDIVFLQGRVEGKPNSDVFLGVTRNGIHGLVRLGSESYVVATGVFARLSGSAAASDSNDLNSIAARQTGFSCGANELPLGETAAHDGISTRTSGNSIVEAVGRVVLLGVETDFEFTNNLFGGDVDVAAAYVASLVGAVSHFYSREVDTVIRLGHLGLWTTSDDPWEATDIISQFFEFRSFWAHNSLVGTTDIAFLLSARKLFIADGVAGFEAVCSPAAGYGVVSSLKGVTSSTDLDHLNFDLLILSHEIGHTLGAVHTQDLNSPPDACSSGNCSVIPEGTLMSACYFCPGGTSNVRLEFTPEMRDVRVLEFLNERVPCDLSAKEPVIVQQPISQIVCVGEQALLNVEVFGSLPMTYSWRKQGDIVEPGGTASVGSAQMTIDSATLVDAGRYEVVVANAFGDVVSQPVFVTVEDCSLPRVPRIVEYPVGRLDCAGSTIDLSVSAVGSDSMTYQWRKNGTVIGGASLPTFSLESANKSDSGDYEVRITNELGQVSSGSVTITVFDCAGPDGLAAEGSRHIVVDPSLTDTASSYAFAGVGLRLTSTDYPCLDAYVDAEGRLLNWPTYLQPDVWGRVDIADLALVPSSKYAVQFDYGKAGYPLLSEPIEVETGVWADVAGAFIDGAWTPPDDRVDFNDISASIACFQTLRGAPTKEKCDLHPASPNFTVDLQDISSILRKFRGYPYPYSIPCE